MRYLFLIPCLWLVLATAALGAAVDELKDDLAKLQGKWKATVVSDGGEKSTWTLEIKNQKAKFTITSDGGETRFRGESDFKLEKMGKFKGYTYFNLEIQSGDRTGEKLLTGGETRSSAYRIDGDTWYTAGGLEEGTDSRPVLIKWERTAK